MMEVLYVISVLLAVFAATYVCVGFVYDLINKK